jgi:spermidine synthase
MSLTPARRHYVLIFVLSLALLMLEIATARILSVVLLSHYAFVAISLAMFGLGLSALVVYLEPDRFRADRLDELLTANAWRFGLSAVLCELFFINFPVTQELSLSGFLSLSMAYTVLAVPFFFGGLCIALLMTHFSASIDRIYGADLLGASLGCLAVVAAMQLLPAPYVPAIVGLLASLSALGMALTAAREHVRMPAVSLALVAVLLAVGIPSGLFTLRNVKNWYGFYSQYEAWNAFSRVSAFTHSGTAAQTLPVKGPDSDYAGGPGAMFLDIDGTAWTPMIEFDGDVAPVAFLRESVNYIAHHLRPGGRVLIIGTGGGRDLLAAHVFGQPRILGIELNPLMGHIVNEVYGDYSGRPYTDIGAEVIFDEARSRLGYLDERFDVIQLSLIDTFSLNASGGFVFSENYLYTQEGFQEYFRHLSDAGVLSVTRYFAAKYPVEILRLLAMVSAAWRAEGVRDPSQHLVVLNQGLNGTLLAKRTPFTPEERAQLTALAAENNIAVLYMPGAAGGHREITDLLTRPDQAAYIEGYPFLIDPPTDDRPFFFHFLRGRLAEEPSRADDPFGFLPQWNHALSLMYLLIAVVMGLAAVFFFGPLVLLARRGVSTVPWQVAAPLLLYFACLGYGFMVIEIPIMQRLILFLGYPVYALAVVLFALLLFSGLGALLTSRFKVDSLRSVTRVLTVIVALSLLYAFALPAVLRPLMGIPIGLKIVVSAGLLAPIGVPLGMAYPLGITVLRRFGEGLVPWAWGLNGALSVVASVLAIFISSRVGFTVTMITGSLTYAVALACMLATSRRQAATAGTEPVAVARARQTAAL